MTSSGSPDSGFIGHAENKSRMDAIPEERENASTEPVTIESLNNDLTNDEPATTIADVPLVFIPKLPTVKYHHKPLQFTSKPGIKQEEYEKKILAQRSDPLDETECDKVSIRCRDKPDGTARIFTIKRSDLERFPTFHQFIRSEHFTPGCDMSLDFLNDPAVCFELALSYLESEGGGFGVNELIVTISGKYNLRDRLIVLARLHKLAKGLGDDGLAEVSMQALWIVGRRMKAEHVTSLASLIFSPKLAFLECVKEWIISVMGQHINSLANSWEWEIALASVHEDLLAEWLKMCGHQGDIARAAEAEDDSSILSALNAMSTGHTIAAYNFVPDETFVHDTTDAPSMGIRVPIEDLFETTSDAGTQTEPHKRLVPTVGVATRADNQTTNHNVTAPTPDAENAASAGTTIVAPQTEGIADIEDGWEDIQSSDERANNGANENAKARTVLGISEASGRASTSVEMESTRHSFGAETAKARAVMGINGGAKMVHRPVKRNWRRVLR